MSVNYKDGYVTTSEFKANRPDLSVHSNNAIQAAIYQACAMLNSHTDGKIKSVWDYTNNTENPETTNDLYRTETELEYISEAIILQTQFLINMGNDLTVGSGSYSLGGATYSDSIPIGRETIAPGVNQMLSKARVYDFFAMGNNEKKLDGVGNVYNPETTYYNKLTVAQLDARYQLAHPLLSNSNGKIATIAQGDGTNTSIVWTDPPTVDLQEYYTMEQVNSAIQTFWNTNISPYAGIEWCNNTFVTQNQYNSQIQDITSKLKTYYNSIYGNTTSIASLNDRVRALENKTGSGIDFSEFVTQDELATQLANYVTSSNLTTQLANYVTTTNANNTYAPKESPIFSVSTGSPIKITTPANNSGYIEFVRNNNNAGYVGLGSSANNNLMLGCRNGSVKLEPSNNQVDMSSARVINVATPTANTDAANKAYVDSKVAAGGGSGGVAPDLSNYVTNTQLTTQLNNYVSNSNLTTQLNNYVPKSGGTVTGNLTVTNNSIIKQSNGNNGVVTNTSTWQNQNYISTKYTTNVNNISDANTYLKIEANVTNQTGVITGNNLTITGLVNPTQNNQAATKQYVDNAIANIPQPTQKYWYKFFVNIPLSPSTSINATPTNPYYKTVNLNTIQSQLSYPTYNVIKNMKFVSATPFGFTGLKSGSPDWGINIPYSYYIQGSSNGGIPTTLQYLQIAVNITNYSGTIGKFAISIIGVSDTQLSGDGLQPISLARTKRSVEEPEIEIQSIELL